MTEQEEGRSWYRLKRPCATCPFRADRPFYLTPGRAAGIAADLREGNAFHCHKTTEEGRWFTGEDDQERYFVAGTEAMCAGALITMEKEGTRNTVTQLGIYLGYHDPDALDLGAPTYGSLDEFVEDKERTERRGGG